MTATSPDVLAVVKQAVAEGLAEHVDDEMELLREVRAMARASRIILRVLIIFAGMLVLLNLSIGYLVAQNGNISDKNNDRLRAQSSEIQASFDRLAAGRENEHDDILQVVCTIAADVPSIRLPREC